MGLPDRRDIPLHTKDLRVVSRPSHPGEAHGSSQHINGQSRSPKRGFAAQRAKTAVQLPTGAACLTEPQPMLKDGLVGGSDAAKPPHPCRTLLTGYSYWVV
jgi:hypothetical protein